MQAKRKAKAEARQLELVKEAAVESLRHQFGKSKKQKVAPDPVREKLSKAWRCSQTMPAGMHKDNCTFHPANMRSLLRHNATNRVSIENQLRTRTSLSLGQREAALEYLFGPAVVISPGAEAGTE